MSCSALYRKFEFFVRVAAAILLTWLLSGTQSIAWQNAVYHPYYSPPGSKTQFRPYAQPDYYRPYYPGYYYPRQASYAPPTSSLKPGPKSSVLQKPYAEGTDSRAAQQPKAITGKKQAFIDALLPHIKKENSRLRQLRVRIREVNRALDDGYAISKKAERWLQQLKKQYRVQGDPLTSKAAREELLKKIDIIPPSLTLAQAANESAWGRSRFASEANNLFGIWTYDESQGLKPRNREAEKSHLVRKFKTQGESVKFYMHMLNSHPAYKKLRTIRHAARLNRQIPDGLAMANGLEKYSAKGKDYIQLIQELIRQNQWARLDTGGQST